MKYLDAHYRKLTLKTYPDKFPALEQKARAVFNLITEAKDFLKKFVRPENMTASPILKEENVYSVLAQYELLTPLYNE